MREETSVLWADNIQFLAKQKGLKLADISKELDIPTSFYSRARKGDTAANAYTLDKLAGKLGVTLDALMHYNFGEMTDNEKLVINFIQKVLRQTNEGTITWRKEKVGDFEGKWVDGAYLNVEHPLFTPEPGSLFDFADALGAKEKRYVYSSGFHMKGSKIQIMGDCFDASIGKGSSLYLMHVKVHGNNVKRPDITYELYLRTKGELKPVCCSTNEGGDLITDSMLKLRVAAAESSAHLRLTDDVKSFLETFIE